MSSSNSWIARKLIALLTDVTAPVAYDAAAAVGTAYDDAEVQAIADQVELTNTAVIELTTALKNSGAIS